MLFQKFSSHTLFFRVKIKDPNLPGKEAYFYFNFQTSTFEVKLFKSVSSGTEEAGEDEVLPSAKHKDLLLLCSQGNDLVISFAICFTKKAPLCSFLGRSQDDGHCPADPEGLAVAYQVPETWDTCVH